MSNTKRVIVVLVVLVGGVMLTGCGGYSKLENDVFNEVDKLSKSIPEGFAHEDATRSAGSIKYSYIDDESEFTKKGKLQAKSIEFLFSPGISNILNVTISTAHDKDTTSILGFWARPKSKYTHWDEEPESFQIVHAEKVRVKGPDKVSSRYTTEGHMIYYEKRKDWKRYDVEDALQYDFDPHQYRQFLGHLGKRVPTEQVQRYIDLVERFKETYSLPDKQGE